jgi:hypothetical protein
MTSLRFFFVEVDICGQAATTTEAAWRGLSGGTVSETGAREIHGQRGVRTDLRPPLAALLSRHHPSAERRRPFAIPTERRKLNFFFGEGGRHGEGATTGEGIGFSSRGTHHVRFTRPLGARVKPHEGVAQLLGWADFGGVARSPASATGRELEFALYY